MKDSNIIFLIFPPNILFFFAEGIRLWIFLGRVLVGFTAVFSRQQVVPPSSRPPPLQRLSSPVCLQRRRPIDPAPSSSATPAPLSRIETYSNVFCSKALYHSSAFLPGSIGHLCKQNCSLQYKLPDIVFIQILRTSRGVVHFGVSPAKPKKKYSTRLLHLSL